MNAILENTIEPRNVVRPTSLAYGKHRNRNRQGIIFEILEFCWNPKIRTHIMEQVNLSYDQLLEYLSLVLDLGLLKESRWNGAREVYETTELGHKYMFIYLELMALCPMDKWVSEREKERAEEKRRREQIREDLGQ